MESVSRREEVLLGYNSITLSNSQRRNSDDVDFSDVFGGPPRRASTQSGDSHSNGDNNEEGDEGSSSSSWWMKLREKPVFGEATTAVRRRYTSDDFFDDIFRGDQPSSSCSQSPRVSYLSAPGSRVMSPSRSLPPAPLFASPTKFSLPTRATTAEFTASTSTNQTSYNPPMSRFNQTTQNHASFLPRHNSSESTSDRQLEGAVDQSSPLSNAKGSDFPIYATNFHFSIYKWGSKSVPLVVSLRKKSALSKATNLEHSSSERAEVIDADMLFSENHNVYVSDAVFSTKNVRPSSPVKEYEQRNDSFKFPVTTEVKSEEDVTAPAESNPTVRPSDAVYRARKDARESRNLTSKSSDSKVHKGNDSPELPTQMNSNLRPLSSFLNNDSTGNERINTKSTGDKISRVKEKEKAASVEDVMSHKVNKSTVRKSSQSRRKDGSNNNEALGKVKDFVKIFNQESPLKASSHGLHKSHSKKWKDAKTIETDQEIRLSSAKMEENEATYVNWGDELTDTVEMEDGLSSESQQFTMNDIGSEPPNVEQPSVNASTADSLKDSAPINSTPSDDDVLSNEAIKGYETKVLQWSKGKEGNIRSLLSTLQYVLWSESGWKPVPLVDIIEANAVKRAYQKALLRLHPDKLQQKGAAAHQKLIAEKVFDILQEAWDEFNSLGSL